MASRPTIVCAVDRSRRAHHVARVSRGLAEALDVQVVLTHVFDPMMVPAPPTRELDRLLSTEDIEQHERGLAHRALARTAEFLGDVGCTTAFAEGRPEAEILRVVDDHGARLLVTGSGARTPVERVMGGSLSAELAVAARCPVVVVTDNAEGRGAGPVLAAYDGSDHSLRAARHAAGLAVRLARELVLMHVAAEGEPGPQADEALARELHAAARACAADATRGVGQRLDVTLVVEHGDPVEQLLLAAHERAAPLIVVGSRGRNALKAALLGSVSAGVVRRADRPVVVAGPRAEQPLVASAT
jgi:nucleotide-binding universal stress UspA family protein